MNQLIIDKTHEGQRLDIALSLLMPSVSRSVIKKQIESNNVKVNDEIEYKANYKVKVGDKISIHIPKINDEIKIKPEPISLDIIYEDDDLVAINKPVGMVVHPATGNWEGTVMNAILYKYKNLKDVGESIRSGLIHRLDKDTSGVLLVGKTSLGLWHYTKLFSQRKVVKYYLAVIKGTLPKDKKVGVEFEISSFVARNTINRKKMQNYPLDSNIPKPDSARIAISRFKILDSKDNYHVCLVYPKTGRTHQIRLHSKLIGCPVYADKLYGNKEEGRMMLHAYKLVINDPNGKKLEIVAKPDKEFINTMKNLKLNTEILKNIPEFLSIS